METTLFFLLPHSIFDFLWVRCRVKLEPAVDSFPLCATLVLCVEWVCVCVCQKCATVLEHAVSHCTSLQYQITPNQEHQWNGIILNAMIENQMRPI